jgi:hypothetical protein
VGDPRKCSDEPRGRLRRVIVGRDAEAVQAGEDGRVGLRVDQTVRIGRQLPGQGQPSLGLGHLVALPRDRPGDERDHEEGGETTGQDP